MGFNAVLGSQQFSDVQIIDRTHPAIIRAAAFRQDGRVLPRGRVVAKDSNGAMAAYEPGLADAAAWEAETVYAAGALVLPTTPNGHYYRCTTGGTSHTAEPAFPLTAATKVADATVIWEEAGLIGVDDLTGGGVLTEAIDTAVEGVGPVLKHGTVVADNLDVAGAAAAAADIAALDAIGVYAI